MQLLHDLLLVAHFVGLASLLGAFLLQLSSREHRAVPAMLHGALTQLVTGVLLVGVDEADDDAAEPVDNAKIAVKLVVLLVITALVWRYRRRPTMPESAFFAVGLLTFGNVVVAVFWR